MLIAKLWYIVRRNLGNLGLIWNFIQKFFIDCFGFLMTEVSDFSRMPHFLPGGIFSRSLFLMTSLFWLFWPWEIRRIIVCQCIYAVFVCVYVNGFPYQCEDSSTLDLEMWGHLSKWGHKHSGSLCIPLLLTLICSTSNLVLPLSFISMSSYCMFLKSCPRNAWYNATACVRKNRPNFLWILHMYCLLRVLIAVQ